MRIVVREEPPHALLSDQGQAQGQRTAGVEFYAPDMGPKAVEAALEEEAYDPAIPLPQRIQSLVLSAGMDLAYQRLPAASQKYALLAKYHGALGLRPLHALSLNGIGEVFDRSGNKKQAQHYFEQALVPACQAEDPPR